ncbi:MAG: VOC family protein, partial [Ilumatobacter sp.]
SGLEVGLTTEAAPAPTPTDDDESSIGPLLLFQSHELDDALASVTAGGGRIVTQPFDYPGGRRFHFSDPSGNVLGVDRPDTA